MYSRIKACGHFLPSHVMTNDDLSRIVDTTDEWIVQRTGIQQRHIADQGVCTSDLAVEAAKMALANAGITPDHIDVVIVATATPDETFPATATIVQKKLGIRQGYAFDVAAACGGFILGLSLADMHIQCGKAKTVLLIGAETFSRIMDMTDRNTCVLFGDGAGAVILQESDVPMVLDYDLHSDGQHHHLLYTDGGVSSTGTAGKIRMIGREVYRHAVHNLAESARKILDKHGLSIQDVDWFVPHQANIRIIHSVADQLGLPHDKIIATVYEHANTSAASIPLALSVGIADGRIQKGQLILSEAIGAGLIWGSALFRY